MTRRHRLGTTLPLVATLVLAACGGETTPGGTSPAERPSEPIVIGAAIAKTGGFAPFDAAIMVGVQMAMDDVNANGGVLGQQLELVTADTASDPNQAANAATEVLSQGAKLLITQSDYDQAVGAASVGQGQGVLVFSPAAGSPKYGVQGIGDLAFTMGQAASAEGVINADWAMENGWDSAYVLLDTTLAFTMSHCDGFESRWTDNGGTIVGRDTFANGDPSIQAQITRLSGASPAPDFILLCSYPPGGVTAIKQIRSAGITTPIVVNSSFDGSYWLSSVPGLSDFYQNAYGSYFGNDPRPQVNDVAARLAANETSGDSSLALTGYAVVQAFAEAAERAGSLDGQALATVLETEQIETLLGPALYSETNHIANADRQMAVITIDNGTRKFVTLFASENPPPLDYTSG